MKQRKFGQKVQNWHRPPGREDYKARYRKWRVQGQQRDRQWAFDEPWYDDWFGDDHYWGSDFSDFWRAQLVQMTLVTLHHPLCVLDAILPERAERVTLPEPSEMAANGPLGVAFAEELHRHVRRIQAYRGDDAELVAALRAAVGGGANAEIVTAHAPEYAGMLLLFAPFWRQSPDTWDPESGVSLPDYLLGLYPVPAFLRLRRDSRFVDDKWVCWMLLLGNGVSLKNAAAVFGWDIPGRLPAFLPQVPPDADPLEGCLWGEVLRLGGSETDCRRILGDPSYVFDLTDRQQPLDEVDFWRDTAVWMIRERDAMADEDAALILAWARHRFTEAQREAGEPFRWRGRSLRATLEQSRAYREDRDRLGGVRYAHYAWSAHGWDWTPTEESLKGWSVVELTDTRQLLEEGRAMRHCVGGYGLRCHQGVSAIVSVRHQEERRVTIEVDPATGRMVQVRGAYNRDPAPDEHRVTGLWHATILLPKIAPTGEGVTAGVGSAAE